MDYKEFFKSSIFRWILSGLAIIIVLLLVLQLGIFIGTHKANFSYRWADSYRDNFGGPRHGMMPDLGGRDFFGGHGLTGSIIKTDGSKIILKGDDDKEKIIETDNSTVIRRGREDIKISDLKTNEDIVVVGSPNSDGSTQAKIIRVLDPDFPPAPRMMPFMGGPR